MPSVLKYSLHCYIHISMIRNSQRKHSEQLTGPAIFCCDNKVFFLNVCFQNISCMLNISKQTYLDI